ncbi:hypothetical protein [Pseudonocardia sp. H11422]|uniref:hypothetical protein n=1 Tax=Pseudonocardia sp. H11422 TaxID=2835866 RepID=UPI001BDD203E|nr:hypothetical protein [Pseudonocardia sp. H11422]
MRFTPVTTNGAVSLDDVLVDEAPAVAARTRRLRAVVRGAHPDLRERVYPPHAAAPTDEQLIDYLDLAVEHAVAVRSVRREPRRSPGPS